MSRRAGFWDHIGFWDDMSRKISAANARRTKRNVFRTIAFVVESAGYVLACAFLYLFYERPWELRSR